MSTINIDDVRIEQSKLHIVEELQTEARTKLGHKVKIDLLAERQGPSLTVYAGSKANPKLCKRTFEQCYWMHKKSA